jgi:hypothetical protein
MHFAICHAPHDFYLWWRQVRGYVGLVKKTDRKYKRRFTITEGLVDDDRNASAAMRPCRKLQLLFERNKDDFTPVRARCDMLD